MDTNHRKAAFTNNLEVPIVTNSERSKMQQNETKNNRKMTEQEFLLAEYPIQNTNQKSEKEYRKIEISSPILYTTDIKTDFITIKHPSARSEDILSSPLFNPTSQESLKDSRRASIMSSFSSDSFEFIKPESITSSYNEERLKNKRSISTDSGVSSLSKSSSIYDSNEFFTSAISEDSVFTENLKDEKNKLEMSTFKDPFQQNIPFIPKEYKIEAIKDSNEFLASIISEDSVFTGSEESFSVDKKKEIVQSNSATIRRSGTGNKPIKVAIPVVPTLNPTVSDQESIDSVEEKQTSVEGLKVSDQESIDSVEEKETSVEGLKVLDDVSKVNGELQRKEQLLSQIEQFIPEVNISARKTTEAKVKYGTLDMLKITVKQLDLKIKAIDSPLKNKPLMKKLKHDLKKGLHKVNKQQSKEEKLISIREKQEQGQLQNKILKQDIDKIKNVISTAKSKTNLEERSNLLGMLESDLKAAYSHLGKNLHPDLKKAITELRKEKWTSQTNIWAIRPTEITKNYLPESKTNLTFAEKREIYSHKRDTAKELLDSDLDSVRSEDKEMLKELYKHYTKLAKSSENKPKERFNLEKAFNKEFGSAYQQAQQDLEKELITKVINIHFTQDKESQVPKTKISEASIKQLTINTANR